MSSKVKGMVGKREMRNQDRMGLLKKMLEYKDTLFGALTPYLTQKVKDECWEKKIRDVSLGTM